MLDLQAAERLGRGQALTLNPPHSPCRSWLVGSPHRSEGGVPDTPSRSLRQQAGSYDQITRFPLPTAHSSGTRGSLLSLHRLFARQASTQTEAHHDLRTTRNTRRRRDVQGALGNFIGGEFVAPVNGEYFTNTSPVTGEVIAEFPRSSAADIEKALDAAHAAADAWGKTSAQDRSLALLKIADRIEKNLEFRGYRNLDNGKAVRETLNADVPLAADHFRYFAGCIRAQEGGAAEINELTTAYHFHEPWAWSGRSFRGTSRC